MITIYTVSRKVEFTSFKFSGGEVNVKILQPELITAAGFFPVVFVTANIKNSDDLMELLLLTDAIRQISPRAEIELTIPYLPYARQDRVMVPGESMSLKVFASIINAQNYAQVRVWDAHSDVGVALIDRCTSISQDTLALMMNFNMSPANTVLVSPDAGAEKKIYKFAKALSFKDIVFASKVRDVATGKILKTTVSNVGEVLGGSTTTSDKDFLIVDDICDGGGTFIALAEKLRPYTTGKIKLLVTHGIFSKGVEVFDGIIDEVMVINNINGVVSTKKTKVIS